MSNLEALERRIRELEDERALRNLVAFYSFNADFRGRADDYVAMYTDDGVMDVSDMGLPRYEGAEDLRRFIEGREATMFMERSMHHAAPTVFYIDGDEAVGEGYSILYVYSGEETPGDQPLQGAIAIPHANISSWKFRRVDGKWKIVERKAKLLGSPEAGELLRSTAAALA